MKKTNIEQWLKAGKHLPDVLRDFHDQKETFKAIDEIMEHPADSPINRPSWMEAHCYVIDVFLWWMARRGYTLQRTKRRGNFRDLRTDVLSQTKRRTEVLAELMSQPQAPAKADIPPSTMDSVSEGLGILARYAPGALVSTNTTAVYAGPAAAVKVATADLARLAELGWSLSEAFDCWGSPVPDDGREYRAFDCRLGTPPGGERFRVRWRSSEGDSWHLVTRSESGGG